MCSISCILYLFLKSFYIFKKRITMYDVDLIFQLIFLLISYESYFSLIHCLILVVYATFQGIITDALFILLSRCVYMCIYTCTHIYTYESP